MSLSKKSLSDESASVGRSIRSSVAFKISEWPSNEFLRQQEEDEKSRCVKCLRKTGKLSVLEGKKQSNLPSEAIIDYFITQIEHSDGKIEGSKPALITTTKTFTYQEIHEKSDQMASILKSKLNGKHTNNPDGDFVIGMALSACRDIRIITQLAILKTGCCYFPIDFGNCPPRRILKMTNLISPLIIITTEDEDTMEKLKALHDLPTWETEVLTIEELWKNLELPEFKSLKIKNRKSILLCPDYVQKPIAIYFTYGPLGPEGIRISNKALWNRVIWEWETFPYEKQERLVLQSHAVEIQSVAETFTPLLAGMPILITDRLHIHRLLEDIHDHQVSRLGVFPSFLSSILTTIQLYKPCAGSLCENLPPPPPVNVKLWFCYRGSLRSETAREFFSKVPHGTKLVQIHGGIESLQVSSYKIYHGVKCFENLALYEVLPAGSPISNMKIYITDSNLNLVRQGELGEICVSGMQLPLGITGGSEQLVSNPFYRNGEDESHKRLVKCGDYGRIVPGSLFSSPMLVFDGRAETQLIMNNQRVNIKEILSYLKAVRSIKGCHAMAYRPTTVDQALLAFAVVSKRIPVSVTSIINELRKDLPEYMMPVLIIMEGIPVGKDFQVNQTALIQAYFKDGEERMKFEDWDQLGLETPGQIMAAKVIFHIMFTLTRISKRTLSENMNESIFKLRARFSNLPAILLRLRRNGYKIDFDEFVKIKSVRELIEVMATCRDSVGECERLTFVQFYEVETISSKVQKEVFELLWNSSNNMRGSGTLMYYSEVKKNQFSVFFKPLWDLLLSQPLSVFARSGADNRIKAALLNLDFEEKRRSKRWKASTPMKYTLEFIEYFDKLLEEGGQASGKLLQTTFIMVDAESFENYDEATTILNKILEQALGSANSNRFKSYAIISFDYVVTRTAIELFDFEVVHSIQINSFETEDKRKPFKLAPDHVICNLIVKTL